MDINFGMVLMIKNQDTSYVKDQFNALLYGYQIDKPESFNQSILKNVISYVKATARFDTSMVSFKWNKQPPRCVLKKRLPENMQQIYRRTHMSKCDFNKVAKQLFWNLTSTWVFSCKFATSFQNPFF